MTRLKWLTFSTLRCVRGSIQIRLNISFSIQSTVQYVPLEFSHFLMWHSVQHPITSMQSRQFEAGRQLRQMAPVGTHSTGALGSSWNRVMSDSPSKQQAGQHRAYIAIRVHGCITSVHTIIGIYIIHRWHPCRLLLRQCGQAIKEVCQLSKPPQQVWHASLTPDW